MVKKSRLLLFIFLCCVIFGYSQSDEFLETYKKRLSENNKHIFFNVILDSNKMQFRQGETISFTLSFSSDLPNTFQMDSASYDRSGRTSYEGFIIDRKEDTSDPLYEYYNKSFGFFMMGGLRGFPILNKKPTLIKADLNEWVRFKKPGKYRVYIVSHRIGSSWLPEGGEVQIATSNLLEIEILPPDSAWETKKLKEITGNISPNCEQETCGKACSALRFMGTERATVEILKRFEMEESGSCAFEYYIGLLSSPHRKLIISEMEKKIEDPKFAVSDSFLHVLTRLSYFVRDPSPFPKYSTDEKENKARKLEMASRKKIFDTEYERTRSLLETAIKTKKQGVYARSFLTLLNTMEASEITQQHIGDLIEIFPDLPRDKQSNLIIYQWEKIRNSLMIPLLRKIYSDSRYSDREEIKGFSLKRLYELAPKEARPLIISAIRNPSAYTLDEILFLLPDTELPELESEWAKRAINLSADFGEREKLLDLLERYGTKETLPMIRETYEPLIGQIECKVQNKAIAFFLKNDKDLGETLVDKAMKSRTETKCYNSTFNEIRPKYWSDRLQEIALANLEGENIGLAADLAEILGKYGNSDAKDKIMIRFVRFLKGLSATDLKFKRYGDYSYSLSFIESKFIRALKNSENWKLSEDEAKKLSEVCLTKSCKTSLLEP